MGDRARAEGQVILVDDNSQRRQEFGIILDFLGENPVLLDSEEWREFRAADQPAAPISAVVLGCGSGAPLTERVAEVRDWNPGVPVLLLGDHGPDRLEDPALRNRVIARLAFPPSYNKLLDTLHRAQVYREHYAARNHRQQQRELQLFRSLVGTSRAIQKLRQLMHQVADKDVTVLILGESGTGKEVVARNLHYHSHRRDKPFVPVNCGAIPRELLESELFGHEKGAFTGAISSRAGRFELAEGGTLFLDEIGDMPLDMQVKILRVLQERSFERVGSNRSLQADDRVVAATHKNLEQMIEEGSFREDLYYRLNVFPIEVAPLRERTEDIPLLINDLVTRMEKEKRGSIRFNSAAILSLCRHAWSGNVRELANLVERMAILAPYGVVGVQDLPRKFRHIDIDDEDVVVEAPGELVEASFHTEAQLPVNGIDLRAYLEHQEQSLIRQALEDAGGVVARAAEKLQVRRTTLVEKMRKYGLTREQVSKA